MRLLWETAAQIDIIKIWRYIALEDARPMTATAVFERIQSAVQILAEMPEIGRAGRMPRTRELVIAGSPFIAIYRLDRNRGTVEILRVIHGAQRWPPN